MTRAIARLTTAPTRRAGHLGEALAERPAGGDGRLQTLTTTSTREGGYLSEARAKRGQGGGDGRLQARL